MTRNGEKYTKQREQPVQRLWQDSARYSDTVKTVWCGWRAKCSGCEKLAMATGSRSPGSLKPRLEKFNLFKRFKQRKYLVRVKKYFCFSLESKFREALVRKLLAICLHDRP